MPTFEERQIKLKVSWAFLKTPWFWFSILYGAMVLNTIRLMLEWSGIQYANVIGFLMGLSAFIIMDSLSDR